MVVPAPLMRGEPLALPHLFLESIALAVGRMTRLVAAPAVPAAVIARPGAALAQLGACDLVPLLVAEALPPEAAQLGHGEVGPLGLAGLRPELVLERVGEDAAPLGFGLDEVMPQGEFIDQGAVDAGDLEILPPPGDAIAEFAEPGRQELAKERLEEGSLLLDLAELPCLPAPLFGIEHGVEAEAVGMKVGIGDALDRADQHVDDMHAERDDVHRLFIAVGICLLLSNMGHAVAAPGHGFDELLLLVGGEGAR